MRSDYELTFDDGPRSATGIIRHGAVTVRGSEVQVDGFTFDVPLSDAAVAALWWARDIIDAKLEALNGGKA